MSKKKTVMTPARYTVVGRRHLSEAVEREATETASRWTRDVGVLRLYGFGQQDLETFEALRGAHRQLRAARPEGAAAKAKTVRKRDENVAAAWDWIDRAEGILGRLSREDSTLAEGLDAALPEDDSQLSTGIPAVAKLLQDYQVRLPADSDAGALLAEADGLAQRVGSAPAEVAQAKEAKVADTAEIDLLDGKLAVTMSDLNKAARKAIRNGKLKARLEEYRFHYLNRSGGPGPAGGAGGSGSGAPAA